MNDKIIFGIIVASIITALIRIVPILFLSRHTLPRLIRYWLHFIPSAVLSAIIATEIIQNNHVNSYGISIGLLAALTTIFVGFLTRSLFVMVIVSILAYLFFQNI
ncbi:AzlD domain-containing protein [Bartonella tamiae]|uniref:Branched-chain amino acid transporter n=1 Tax=Bartonella tamiae Th239 TaxID=1094558 RepID=J0QS81_9HYPH|nr:AzlD domain-containing protein [Bartonella tamiae]EJF88726.1 hypothetical protein ME5_01277 [Bartonella tamiae Th239]EJF95024.1 hypothetical protein MEG_00605 [Bartonella tamiae Th307]